MVKVKVMVRVRVMVMVMVTVKVMVRVRVKVKVKVMGLNWEEIAKFTDNEIGQLVAFHTIQFIKEIEFNTKRKIGVFVEGNNYENGLHHSRLLIHFRRTNETTNQCQKTNQRNSALSKPNQQRGGSTQVSVEKPTRTNFRPEKSEKESNRQGTKNPNYEGLKIIQGEKMEHDRKDN